MKSVLKSLLVIVILAAICTLVLFLYWGYEPTVYFAAQVTGSLYRLEKFKALFSPGAFHAITVMIAFVILVLLVIFRMFERIYALLARFIAATSSALGLRLRRDWADPIFVCLLVIPVAASVYYALRLPVDWDEAYTYIKFTSRSVFSCISYYPAPNNHILFSALTSLFLHLPFADLVCMRIPAILIGILCQLFLFSFIREYYDRYVAYIAVAVFSTLHMSLLYSFLSRGYGLQCLCFILMSYSIFKVIGRSGYKLYWAYYVIASILGFYTMPSFLYAFAAGNVLLLFALRRPTTYYLVSGFTVVSVTILLYTPIILFNGLDALTNNEFVNHVQRYGVLKYLPYFCYRIVGKITRVPVFFLLAIIFTGIWLMVRRYKGPASWFFPLFLPASLLLMVVHGVIPFERTYEYFNAIFGLLAGVVLYEALRRFPIRAIYYLIALVMIQALLLFNFDSHIYRDEWQAMEAHRTMPVLEGGKKFYVNSSLFDLFLGFDLRTHRAKDYSIKFIKYSATDLDTVFSTQYDYYIIDSDSDRTRHAKPSVKTNYITVYK